MIKRFYTIVYISVYNICVYKEFIGEESWSMVAFQKLVSNNKIIITKRVLMRLVILTNIIYVFSFKFKITQPTKAYANILCDNSYRITASTHMICIPCNQCVMYFYFFRPNDFEWRTDSICIKVKNNIAVDFTCRAIFFIFFVCHVFNTCINSRTQKRGIFHLIELNW